MDLLAPHAVWQPPVIGLASQCGKPTALWVQETAWHGIDPES